MEELIALVISLRPDGIDAEDIPDFVRLIEAAVALRTKGEMCAVR